MTISASDRVVMTELGDGTGVLLHLDSKFYFTLNTTGVAVWKRLETGTGSVSALADLLVARFDVDRDRVLSDLDALLTEMRNEQLIDELP